MTLFKSLLMMASKDESTSAASRESAVLPIGPSMLANSVITSAYLSGPRLRARRGISINARRGILVAVGAYIPHFTTRASPKSAGKRLRTTIRVYFASDLLPAQR
jgi:hypothetical protein